MGTDTTRKIDDTPQGTVEALMDEGWKVVSISQPQELGHFDHDNNYKVTLSSPTSDETTLHECTAEEGRRINLRHERETPQQEDYEPLKRYYESLRRGNYISFLSQTLQNSVKFLAVTNPEVVATINEFCSYDFEYAHDRRTTPDEIEIINQILDKVIQLLNADIIATSDIDAIMEITQCAKRIANRRYSPAEMKILENETQILREVMALISNAPQEIERELNRYKGPDKNPWMAFFS